MKQNKKFGLILVLMVFLPLVLAFINYSSSSLKNFEWGYDHINEVSFAALFIAIVGCITILLLNLKNKVIHKGWTIGSGILLGILSVYLYVIYSLSHFGF